MKSSLSRFAFLLFGLMTLVTFGGPVAFGLVLRGGASPDWPPDRPIEWITLGLITLLVVGLMASAISLSVANQREMHRIRNQPRLDDKAMS
jgi:hypothetical protein